VVDAVRGVSFELYRGQVTALVGESGSGKSALAAAIAGVLPESGAVVGGTVILDGEDLSRRSKRARRRLRGDQIAFLFQEPGAALNPVLTIGAHLVETLRAHRPMSRRQAETEALRWLERVRLPDAKRRLGSYPHELSGGMKQRAALAMVLCLEPDVLLADEPTTALDATVQAAILDLFREVVAASDRSVLVISHDWGVVAEIADRVLEMKDGRLVAEGPVDDFFSDEPETTASPLGAAGAATTPPAVGEGRPPPDPPVLSARGLRRHYRAPGAGPLDRWLGPSAELVAVGGVDLDLSPGASLGLVGESGCGKSTLGRLLVGIEAATAGQVLLDGRDLSTMDRGERRRSCRRLQLVFQDNGAALDPRLTVGFSVAEGLRAQGTESDPVRRRALVDDALRRVDLEAELAARYPHELSGGQRQRVGIARALVLSPEVLVADEPVSALDAEVRRQVVALLRELQRATGLALLLISHDLDVVASATERVAVMYAGRIVEEGPTEALVTAPRHPYTAGLLAAVPARTPVARRRRSSRGGLALDDPPDSAKLAGPGCAYAPRCSRALPGVCDRREPPLQEDRPGRRLACFHPME